MLITRDDIQRVGDEDTLLHFLEEKLNLPIPEGLPLGDITTRYAKLALGLSGAVVNQVLDCQELIVSPGEPSGIILIRFNNRSGYAEALRLVAAGLDKLRPNPVELCFISMNECFQPFAIANFNDSESQDWQTAVLNIRVWTQENTHIHTSSEHDIRLGLFSKNVDEGVPDIKEDDPLSDKLEDIEETLTSEGYDATQQGHMSEPTTPETLLAKLRKTGRPLSRYGNIHIGITPGYMRAFEIDEFTCKQLTSDDPKSKELIKPFLKPRKWMGELAYVICIPSSKNKRWPWTGRNPSEAERIFETTYPAISDHMKYHKEGLEKRVCFDHSALFYWEFPAYGFYADLKRPKIFYPPKPASMQAAYDDSEKLLFSSAFFPTEDLSLLAILNSKLFAWYTREEFWNEEYNFLGLAKKNMNKAPIVQRTPEQKAALSGLVQRILNNPDSFEVADTEREIDELVYKLYELTDAEIALIEEETSK